MFVLVDLLTQIEHIPQRVRTPRKVFLAWLNHQGEVSQLRTAADFPPAYLFRSQWGVETTFTYREDGRLFLFLGGHRSCAAWSHSEAM